MNKSRKIKSVMTGMMERSGREGRLCRERTGYIEDWCQTDIYSAKQIAHDRVASTNTVTSRDGRFNRISAFFCFG
jgi:hypothetical protein